MTARAWSWAAGSLVLYGVLLVALVPVVIALEQGLGVGHGIALFLWAGSLVVASGLAVLLVGRRVFRLDLHASPAAWLVLATGALLGGWLLVSLYDWATLRVGGDWDHLGPTGWLWAAIAGTATAGFGALIAPREVALPAVLCCLVGASLTALVVAPNVPGVLDGIEPESWALAAVIGLTLAYALGLTVVSVRKLRTGGAPSPVAPAATD